MRLFVLPLICILAGCAPTVWDKMGATQEGFARDSYECEKDVRQSYFGTGLAAALSQKDFYNRCMMVRGYHMVSTQ